MVLENMLDLTEREESILVTVKRWFQPILKYLTIPDFKVKELARCEAIIISMNESDLKGRIYQTKKLLKLVYQVCKPANEWLKKKDITVEVCVEVMKKARLEDVKFDGKEEETGEKKK